MKPTSQIKDEIREQREGLGLTQSDLAAAIGVDPQTVSRWERGERRPKADDYRRALEFFDHARRHRPIGLGNTVPRGTVSTSPSPATGEQAVRRVRAIAARLEADLHEWGAGRSTFDAMRIALATDDTVRMFKDGFVDHPQDIPAAFTNYERFVEALRATLKDRIEILREPPAGSESE